MIGLGLIMPALLITLVLTVMPESPRWLIKNGRVEEAGSILEQVALETEDGTQPNGQELARALEIEINEEIEASKDINIWALFKAEPSRWKMVRAGVGIAIAQQITVEEALVYYMIDILEDAGVTSERNQFGCVIVVGIFKVLAIIVAGYLFDIYGRKTLLTFSNLGIAASLFLLAAVSDTAPAIAFVALVTYVISFSSGMGPGCWLTISEIFTNDIRAKGVSMGTVSNRLAALAITSSFLTFKKALTPAGAYTFFGIIALGNVAFLRKYLPETKGLRLEQMPELFDNHCPD